MFSSLLGEPFPLLAYPLEMVLAEKLVTMIERGVTNTRERDLHDSRCTSRNSRVTAPGSIRYDSTTNGD